MDNPTEVLHAVVASIDWLRNFGLKDNFWKGSNRSPRPRMTNGHLIPKIKRRHTAHMPSSHGCASRGD